MKNKTEIVEVNNKTQSHDVAEFDVNAFLGLPTEASNDQLLDLGVHAYNAAGLALARAGQCFLRIKQSTKHGDFLGMLEQRGVSPDHAQRAMQLARLVARLTPEQARKVTQLAPYKALELAKADDEVVGELLEAESLGDLETLSVRDLRKKVKALQTKTLQLETSLETQTAKYEKLNHVLAHRHDHLQMPPFAANAREETGALTEKMLACVESLDELAATHLFPDRDEPEAERFQKAAAGTLFHSLLAAAARAYELLHKLDKHFGKEVTGTVKFEHQLIKAEAQTYLKIRGAVLEEHAKEAHNREAQRHNEKGGRGRPRKLKA